jgi:heme-degrading monooxygenase HmoA
VLASRSEEIKMIIREWRGRAPLADAARYPAHFCGKVLPELQARAGFVGAHLGQRQLGDSVEFLVLTRWVSMEAIRAFAGADVEAAVVEPEAAAALADYDAKVQHYEILQEA